MTTIQGLLARSRLVHQRTVCLSGFDCRERIDCRNQYEKPEEETGNLSARKVSGCHPRTSYPCHDHSDSHYPDLVNDGREEAFELLQAKGFKTTCELVNGKWEEMAIE